MFTSHFFQSFTYNFQLSLHNFKTNQFSFKIFGSLDSLAKNKNFEKKIVKKFEKFFFKNSKKLKIKYLKMAITQKLRVVDP